MSVSAPKFAAQNTWWKATSTTRPSITQITIVDSYTPPQDGVTESWDASAAEDGQLMCYVIGTELIIAGNGSGKIYTNENARTMFSDQPEGYTGFVKVASITGLNLLNTSQTTNFTGMFFDCMRLTSIDLSSFDTSLATTLEGMFWMCQSLTSLSFPNTFNTQNVQYLAHTFQNCNRLVTLDLSNWDVSKVISFYGTFSDSSNLRYIEGLQNWVTSAGLGFDMMFSQCSKLEELDLSSFDTTHAKNGENPGTMSGSQTTGTLVNFLAGATNLQKITLGPNVSINGDGTNTTEANKLTFPAGAQWYTISGEQTGPKDRTQETYYRDYSDVANMNVVVKNSSLIETAKAIREKTGSTDKYKPSQFAAAIRNSTLDNTVLS